MEADGIEIRHKSINKIFHDQKKYGKYLRNITKNKRKSGDKPENH